MKFEPFTMRCIIAETELDHILLNAALVHGQHYYIEPRTRQEVKIQNSFVEDRF